MTSYNDLVTQWLRDCKRLTAVEESSPSQGFSLRGEASPQTIEAIFKLLDDPKINSEVGLMDISFHCR